MYGKNTQGKTNYWRPDMSANEQLIEFLLQTMKETKSFAIEQAPEVAREMLAYGSWDARLDLFCCMIFLSAAIPLFLMWRHGLKNDSEGLMCVGCMGTIVCLLFGLVAGRCGYANLKKIELEPKVYIIEKLITNRK